MFAELQARSWYKIRNKILHSEKSSFCVIWKKKKLAMHLYIIFICSVSFVTPVFFLLLFHTSNISTLKLAIHWRQPPCSQSVIKWNNFSTMPHLSTFKNILTIWWLLSDSIVLWVACLFVCLWVCVKVVNEWIMKEKIYRYVILNYICSCC